MKRHALRTGEALAIAPEEIKRDSDGFFFLMGPDAPENERSGTVAIVHIRGALAQFKGDAGDSYEAIVERVGHAIESEPTTVLFRISSPGGVAAGLNEAVLKLRKMSKESGVPFVAYIDEMAASAAFAMACACGERLAPPSAVVGSVGVISTMVSVAKQDEMNGIEFRLITSGKRKADGHLHAPLSDAAVAEETRRNTELARQFFALVSEATGLSAKKLASLEAAIYLGKEAERVGLIDDVMSFDDVIGALDQTVAEIPKPAPNEGNITDRRAKELDTAAKPVSVTSDDPSLRRESRNPDEDDMSVKLDSLIAKTEASIASETDPKKRARLAQNLASLEGTRRLMGDDPDDDDDDKKKKDEDDDDEDDDSKSKKASEKAAKMKSKHEAMGHRAKAAEHKAKAAELEEKAKKCEEEAEGGDEEEGEESEEKKASLSLSPGASAAITAQAARIDRLEREAEARDKASAAREMTAMIEEARAQRRITPGESKTLAKKSHTFVKDFLEMRPKALVNVTEESLEQPDGTPAADIPSNVKAIVEQGLQASGLTGEKADKYREESYAAHRKVMSKTNGAGVH